VKKGAFCKGLLLLVEDIDQYHLNDLSRKTERYIKRKICSLLLSRNEYKRILVQVRSMFQHINLGSGEEISRLNVLSKGLSLNHLIY